MNRTVLFNWATVIPVCVLLLGCGESFERADAAKARAALKTGLEAWKEGKSPQALRKNSPEIVFNDPEFMAGKKLLGFELPTEDVHNHLHSQFEVKLSFAFEDEVIEKNIVYIVATHPVLVIARSD